MRAQKLSGARSEMKRITKKLQEKKDSSGKKECSK